MHQILTSHALVIHSLSMGFVTSESVTILANNKLTPSHFKIMKSLGMLHFECHKKRRSLLLKYPDENTKTDSPPSGHHTPLLRQLVWPLSHLAQTGVNSFIHLQHLLLSLYSNSHSENPKTKTLSIHTVRIEIDLQSKRLECFSARREEQCSVPLVHMTRPNQPKCAYSPLAPSSYKQQHS